MVIHFPNLKFMFRNGMQKFVNSSKNQIEQKFFPNKIIDERFNPKAYKLLAKVGYDFTSSSQLG